MPNHNKNTTHKKHKTKIPKHKTTYYTKQHTAQKTNKTKNTKTQKTKSEIGQQNNILHKTT